MKGLVQRGILIRLTNRQAICLPPHARLILLVIAVDLIGIACRAADAPLAAPPSKAQGIAFALPQLQLDPGVSGSESRPKRASLEEPEQSPVVVMTTRDLFVQDPWLDKLTPLQRSRMESFANSLPSSAAISGPDGFLYRAGRVMFPEPVSIRVGRFELGGGIITAIKRKNPFGLLNIFDIFHASF